MTIDLTHRVLAEPTEYNDYLKAAVGAASWIESLAVERDGNLFWAGIPGTPTTTTECSLYYGSAGIVLFFVELFRATHQARYLRLARSAASGLLSCAERHDDDTLSWRFASSRETSNPGLYMGGAGVALSFLELYEATDEDEYLLLAKRAALGVHPQRMSGAGWNGETDILSGAAGVGLMLIRVGSVLQDERLLQVARGAGDYLMAAGLFRAGRASARVSSASPDSRMYPNFAHGTAGMAFFLATLFEATRERTYLDASLHAARWLTKHRRKLKQGSAWYHHYPDGTDLFYAGWCNGPAGTARLFYLLGKLTGDEAWLDELQGCALRLRDIGIFRRRLRGLWNVGMCCGIAGIGDFFAGMYSAFPDETHRRWALACADCLIQIASAGSPGLKWIQAEHRAHPRSRWAQPGYGQGAAGIGVFLLRAANLGTPEFNVRLRLPDDPFPRAAIECPIV